jgi:toxin ParE1/3/4
MAGSGRVLIWAPKARRDLVDIWKYFANAASAEVARGMLREFDRAAKRLMDYPFSGRPREDISPGLRSLLVRPHLIIYRAAGPTIEIVRVLHERRDVSSVVTHKGKR